MSNVIYIKQSRKPKHPPFWLEFIAGVLTIIGIPVMTVFYLVALGVQP